MNTQQTNEKEAVLRAAHVEIAKSRAKLLTSAELAQALKRDVDCISAMKKCGYVPECAALNLHTLEGALAWLKAWPGKFTMRAAYQSKSGRAAKDGKGKRVEGGMRRPRKTAK